MIAIATAELCNCPFCQLDWTKETQAKIEEVIGRMIYTKLLRDEYVLKQMHSSPTGNPLKDKVMNNHLRECHINSTAKREVPPQGNRVFKNINEVLEWEQELQEQTK